VAFWFYERDLGRCLVDFVRGLPPLFLSRRLVLLFFKPVVALSRSVPDSPASHEIPLWSARRFD
jgi:hypothetical protein